MTFPSGTTPAGVYSSSTFAAYAATTQEQWEESIADELTAAYTDAETGFAAIIAALVAFLGGLVVPSAGPTITAKQFVSNKDSTVTAAGTTTLTYADSAGVHVFTGSSTQTAKLPTADIQAGMQYTIINQSTGDVTVQSSGGNTITTLTGASDPSCVVCVALVDTPTTAAHWRGI